MTKTRAPEIRVGLSARGIKQIEVFADNQADRDDALRTILKVSEQLKEIEEVLAADDEATK